MKNFFRTHFLFLFWLLLVIAWNFGVPGAEPIYDVLVAVFLSVGISFLKKKM